MNAQVDALLLHRYLCSNVGSMTDTDPLKWFTETSGHRVTVTRVGKILGVSRNTSRSRLDNLGADDIIEISRGLGINPARALEELGKMSADEIFGYLDGDGTLLAAASPEQLLYRLAEESLPLSSRIRLGATASSIADRGDELAARREAGDEDDGTVVDWDPAWDTSTAADSSPDEDAGREESGSDPFD